MKDHLLGWIGALDEEIEFLSKESAEQALVLTSGTRDPSSAGPGGLYIFLMADALRLPEDAAGTLRAGDVEVPAMVVAHEGNRLSLLLEARGELPEYFASARFEVSETQLLERLKECMTELLENGDVGLGPKVFGMETGRTEARDLPDYVLRRLGVDADMMRHSLEQALGSDVTFLWGPPGTGKTFSIAALVATLVRSGETVVVTSHTHAAVEQALWALVERPAPLRQGGLLHDDEVVAGGRILKLGPLRQPKIPVKSHLDGRLELEQRKHRAEIEELRAHLATSEREITRCRQQLRTWQSFEEAQTAVASARGRYDRSVASLQNVEADQQQARATVGANRSSVTNAQNSFILGRKRRISSAVQALQQAESHVSAIESALLTARRQVDQDSVLVIRATGSLEAAQGPTHGLPNADVLERQLAALETSQIESETRIAELEHAVDDLANHLIDNALGVFVTLTKLYTDPKLHKRHWDTVIIDEASMAMPPLVAWAASRARRRVIICGDFFQLPPIIRSREGLPPAQLGRDVFELRDIPQGLDDDEVPEQLAQLAVQHRMHPSIADVARTLCYGPDNLVDAPELRTRRRPPWCDAVLTTPYVHRSDTLPLDPLRDHAASLYVADISAFHSWCGRVRGSLSRFNFYSAHVAVELAALYALQAPRPDIGHAPPIGIITPYAAQRRYIAKLIESLHLDRSVMVGTVHTFQGNECDLIIFDTVLAEPYWTARLTNPHLGRDVKRDLNVAVTRARHQFVVVADAAWFKKFAKAGSGYGDLWNHLTDHAQIIDAQALLGDQFRSRVATESTRTLGWEPPDKLASITLLDERNFYAAFTADLAAAQERVILYTPYIGKQRWPQIEPHITAAADRDVDVIVLHKPTYDDVWRDTRFRDAVLDGLRSHGVTLIPISGVHAKTVLIDDHIVYEGSLNWASQIESYEHIMRIDDRNIAALEERMMQIPQIVDAFGADAARCPKCDGPLMVVNQRKQARNYDTQPLKLGCINRETSKTCDGYLRDVDQRAPFLEPPICERGEIMYLHYSRTGKPWNWECTHPGCNYFRWKSGDIVPK